MQAGPIYTLADLGTLGGSSTMATGVNDFGQTVGTATTQFGYMHAFSSLGSGLGSGLTDLTVNRARPQASTTRDKSPAPSISEDKLTPPSGITASRTPSVPPVLTPWQSTTWVKSRACWSTTGKGMPSSRGMAQ
jgi:hypothetical protein